MRRSCGSSRLIFLLLSTLTLLSACSPARSPSPLFQTKAQNKNSDNGIIGGVAVDPTDEIAKSTVAIGTLFSGSFCTGTLIAKNLVMTAAHCTGVARDPRMLVIIFGSDLKSSIETRKVLGGKVPDGWPKNTDPDAKDQNDIALLKFEGQAPSGFKPIPMLRDSSQMIQGMEVLLAGYGLIKMDPEEEPMKLMKATVTLSDVHFSKTEVAFHQYQGRGACHGDSGGPAYATIHGKTYVIAVTSRSLTVGGGDDCAQGSVYTSVPEQIGFFRAAAESLNSPNFVAGELIPQPNISQIEPQ